MNALSSPEQVWRIGLILLAATVLYALINKKTLGRSYLTGLTLRGRKNSTATTPPRSFSPEKTATSPKSPSTYTTALPPQRRKALADIKCANAPYRDLSEDEVHRNILPMSADYRSSLGNKYTPTGFSVNEIKALGDFPDYATLSGVPLPSPYPEFDIEKALPRPYRPFRWAYHQTMCTFPIAPILHDLWLIYPRIFKQL
jgi:hypothetical protein